VYHCCFAFLNARNAQSDWYHLYTSGCCRAGVYLTHDWLYPCPPTLSCPPPLVPPILLSQITGFIPTVLLFEEILERVFADEVSGIDCVVASETQALTYTVVGGVARLVYVSIRSDPIRSDLLYRR